MKWNHMKKIVAFLMLFVFVGGDASAADCGYLNYFEGLENFINTTDIMSLMNGECSRENYSETVNEFWNNNSLDEEIKDLMPAVYDLAHQRYFFKYLCNYIFNFLVIVPMFEKCCLFCEEGAISPLENNKVFLRNELESANQVIGTIQYNFDQIKHLNLNLVSSARKFSMTCQDVLRKNWETLLENYKLFRNDEKEILKGWVRLILHA